ncbi:MAG: DUF4139 domain-containing protein [Chitinispirillales bacterium]|jgi:hypothetical protein|nr:DUF4139 domain-containing protein [Chitinispirillales bacterium]
MIKFVKKVAPALALCVFTFSLHTSAHHHRGQNRYAQAQTEPAVAEQAYQAASPAQARPGQGRPAQAEPLKTTADDRQNVEVTIYNSDLGLVKEHRAVRIAAGEGELQFIDVPTRINPVTVHINPLGNAPDFIVLEQNYEFDLISHAKLMEKYIGKMVKIKHWNQYHDRYDIVDAELLSVANGEVFRIDGEIFLGHPGIKILPEIPGNLISRPTLSWIYRSRSGGVQQLEVSYLTSGMNWNADYILLVSDGHDRAGLSGWVTVNNRSGAEFENAKLKLVAGNVNRVRPQAVSRARSFEFEGVTEDAVAFSAPPPAFVQSEVFEYHMYDLQRPTTLKNNQTKQISLMEAQGVTIEKEYTTSGSAVRGRGGAGGGPVKQPVIAFFKFKNSSDNQLGDPLPAGVVRLYTADNQGRQQFIGEDRIQHTPRDEEIRLRAGEAFDIVAERTQVDFRQITNRQHEIEWTIAVRNRKSEDITVGILESAHGTWEIRQSTHRHTRTDANNFRFDVPVKAGEEVIVRYRVRIGS